MRVAPRRLRVVVPFWTLERRTLSAGRVLDDRQRLLELLQLRHYTEEEMKRSMAVLRSNEEAQVLARKLGLRQHDGAGDQDAYVKDLRTLAEKLDRRLYPIATSFLFAGISIGAIIPILPVLAQTVHISSFTYSVVVSCFAGSRLVGNVFASSWAESHGRKKIMVAGLFVCSGAIAAVGATPSLALFGSLAAGSWLIACRIASGFGVALFQTASLILLSNDLANPLNRTRTLAPVSSMFQAGMSIGPLLGGIAVMNVGLANTYLAVGGSLALLAIVNRFTVPKTHVVAVPPQKTPSPPLQSAFQRSLSSWRTLLNDDRVKGLVVFQTVYWSCLAGVQFTLLPLELVSVGFSTQELGICFATVSVTSFITASPFAKIADRKGKIMTMTLGALGVAGTFLSLPFVETSFHFMLGVAVCLGLSNTLLGATPVALMSDFCADHQRSHAMSLIRTAQDLGFLIGATGAGVLSMFLDAPLLMQGGGFVMVGSLLLLYRLRRVSKMK